MKKQQDNPGVQAETVSSETQRQQLSRNIRTQIAKLKQMVSTIQQQSMAEMQDAIDNALKTLTSDNLQQLSKQDSAFKQLTQTKQDAENMDNSPANLFAAANSAIQESMEAGSKAMEYAQNSVRNALAGSGGILEDAQKASIAQNPQTDSSQ